MQTRAKSSASAEQVWAVLADVADWPSWSPTMTSVEPVDPAAPVGVGAAFRVRQPRLAQAVWTISEWRPNRSFTWISSSRGVTTTATHELVDAADGGTEIVLGLEWSGPLSGIVRLLYGRLARRYVDTEARSLSGRAAARR